MSESMGPTHGCPARRKCHAREKGTGIAEFVHAQLDVRVLIQKRNFDDAEHVDAKHNQNDARNVREQKFVYELA